MKVEAVDFFYLSMPEITTNADGSQDALIVRVCAGGLTVVHDGVCEYELIDITPTPSGDVATTMALQGESGPVPPLWQVPLPGVAPATPLADAGSIEDRNAETKAAEARATEPSTAEAPARGAG